jgi:hypothetical protein
LEDGSHPEEANAFKAYIHNKASTREVAHAITNLS